MLLFPYFDRIGDFHMERNIESLCFSNDNHFVLISINGVRKPAQLCLLDNRRDGKEAEECYLQELAEDEDIYGDKLKIVDTNSKEL